MLTLWNDCDGAKSRTCVEGESLRSELDTSRSQRGKVGRSTQYFVIFVLGIEVVSPSSATPLLLACHLRERAEACRLVRRETCRPPQDT